MMRTAGSLSVAQTTNLFRRIDAKLDRENLMASSSRQVELKLASNIDRFLWAVCDVLFILTIEPDAKSEASELATIFNFRGGLGAF